MTLTIGVACETAAGERRSALTPETCRKLVDAGALVRVQVGLGAGAHVADARYVEAGAELVADAEAAWRDATLVLSVQSPASTMLWAFREDAVLVGLCSQTPTRTARRRSRGAVSWHVRWSGCRALRGRRRWMSSARRRAWRATRRR